MPKLRFNTPIVVLLAVLAGGYLIVAEARDELAPLPTVVELYTSEGCSSCPPAEAVLGELARREDVLALSFHVDYWDRLGWTDRLGDPAYSRRQRDYARLRGFDVYTPQMVIDGRDDAIGSNRAAVESRLRGHQDRSAVTTIQLQRNPETVRVILGNSESAQQVSGFAWLLAYDAKQTTAIGSGENRGRTVTSFNVVRDLIPLGEWQGSSMAWTQAVPQHADRHLAVLLQAADGSILALGRASPAEKQSAVTREKNREKAS